MRARVFQKVWLQYRHTNKTVVCCTFRFKTDLQINNSAYELCVTPVAPLLKQMGEMKRLKDHKNE